MGRSDLLEGGAHQRQAIVAEEHRAVDEHGRAAEAATGDQLVGIGTQAPLAVVGFDGGTGALILSVGGTERAVSTGEVARVVRAATP